MRKYIHKGTLPGDLSDDDLLDSMIRVNHAGEYGAKRIYQGQEKYIKDAVAKEQIRHMKEQEEPHLQEFSDQIRLRKTRPTLLLPIWHFGGYAMGAITAALGTKSAMTCTAAVESVIDEHYSQQLNILPQSEEELAEKIEKFREEEVEHHDIAIDSGAKEYPLWQAMHFVIENITKTAIRLSSRI